MSEPVTPPDDVLSTAHWSKQMEDAWFEHSSTLHEMFDSEYVRTRRAFEAGYKSALARSHRDLQERYDKAVKALEEVETISASQHDKNRFTRIAEFYAYIAGLCKAISTSALADLRREETKK